MRTVCHKWALAAAIVGVLAACARQEVEIEGPEATPAKAHTIHFTATATVTRTAFGEAVEDGSGNISYPTYWTENDAQVKISLNYESSVVAAVNPDEQDASGNIIRSSFDASFDGIDAQDPYKFYVVSPASALLWPSAERGAVSVHILSEQTPTAASIDEAAQIIVAESQAYEALPDAVDVHFGHLTAYGKLTLKNVTVPQGAEVTSVRLVSEEQPLTGDWYYKFEDGTMEEKEASSSLIIRTDNLNLVTDPVWFSCAPVDMGGKKLKVYVGLSNAKALYREITLKSGVQLVSGGIYKFSVNMADATLVDNAVEVTHAEDVYQLVKSASSLSAGDEVIFLDSPSSPGNAMAITGGTSGQTAVAKNAADGFTLGSDGYIRLPRNSSVAKLTVDSATSSTISFKYGSSYYLYSGTDGSSRYLQFSTSRRNWSFSIANSGAATMYYYTSGRNYYVRYNNNYFNVNRNTGTFAIYKKITVTSTESVDMSHPAVLEYSDFGAYLPGRFLVYNASTDQLSREYESDGSLTFAILAPEEDQALEFIGIPSSVTLDDTFSLRVRFLKSSATQLDGQYDVRVAKEEGHVLWLADTYGNGFIVKR